MSPAAVPRPPAARILVVRLVRQQSSDGRIVVRPCEFNRRVPSVIRFIHRYAATQQEGYNIVDPGPLHAT